ncbi:hybrid sensor histidine kinase/response regulator [Brevundimonas sp.]|uniref:ATP-binding response regulator n=1 Tax=Brevundimonas sp. TaxID=1871086 RepID=UPI002ABBCEFD|nr:response regulator [Brevundimonas sp.]MDZ4362615.1 response regulator [Brevundimonas sp.]
MELILVIVALVLSGALAALRLAMRARGEAARLRALNNALEARIADRTRALRLALEAAETQSRALSAGEAARSAFLGRLCHELRTPLNAVVGFSDLMAHAEAEPLTHRQAQGIDHIRKAARRLCALVDCVLDLETAGTVPGLPIDTADDSEQGLEPAVVLYVEDHPANADLMRHILPLLGPLTLHVATTGQAGLSLARDLQPDLILLDINLPDMDGFRVKARLDADPLTRGLPVVALTADARAETARRGRESGFTGWLTKPVGIPALATALTRALADRPLPRRAPSLAA